MGSKEPAADPELTALAQLTLDEEKVYYADLAAQTAGGTKPKDTAAYKKLLSGSYRVH